MSLFERIDHSISKLKKSEKVLIYTTIFALVLAVAYEILYPSSEHFLKTKKLQKENIEQKIMMDKSYLQAMRVNNDQFYYVKFYEKELRKIKDSLRKIINKKAYIDNKIQELSYLLYNKQKWAQFLNSITQKAYNNRVEIDYITNSFLDVTSDFGHVLEIEIGCNGDFRGLIGFLNAIEESDLVVDIYALQMIGDSPIKLNFKVSVWGINY